MACEDQKDSQVKHDRVEGVKSIVEDVIGMVVGFLFG